MPGILDKYLELTPNDQRDSATIAWELGQQFESRGVDFSKQDPEFSKYYDYLKEIGTPSLGEEFVKGVKRGVDQAQSTYYGGAALVADALGWEGGKEWAMEGHDRNVAEAAENAATINDYADVDSFSDGLRFFVGKSGEVLYSGIESVATGALSGGIGAPIAKQIAKRQIKKTLAKRVGRGVAGEALEATQRKAREKLVKRAAARARTLAQGGGVFASSWLQSSGEVYGEIYDTAATRGDRIKASLVAGTISGALDSVIPVTVLRRMFPPSVAKDMAEDQIKKQGLELLTKQIDDAFAGYAPLKRKFIGTLAKATGGEAITEVAQELVQEGASAYADPDYKWDTDRVRNRLINAAIVGAIGGSQFGGVSATLDTVRQSGENKRLNDWQELEYELKQAADNGDQSALDKFNAKLNEDYDLDTDLLTLAPLESENDDLKDLIDYESARDAGGEGPVAALIRYKEEGTGKWMNAKVRANSIEEITEGLQQQGVENAVIIQISDSQKPSATAEERAAAEARGEPQQAEGEDSAAEDTSEPTEEEVAAAQKKLRKEGVKLEDFNEEDQGAIVHGAVQDARQRKVVGEVPTAPEPTREDVLAAMREQIAEVDAAQDLTPEEKQAEKLDIELSTAAELDSMGEEFVSDDDTGNKSGEKTQDDGTNTPPVATESGQVTASPVDTGDGADTDTPILRGYQGEDGQPVNVSTMTDEELQDLRDLQVEKMESKAGISNGKQDQLTKTLSGREMINDLIRILNEQKRRGIRAVFPKSIAEKIDPGKWVASPVAAPEVIDPAANPDIGIPIAEQAAPAPLEQTYSDFAYMPAEVLAGRDLHKELAAAHATVDKDGNAVKSKRFTRRAAVLRNTATGEIEVRGSYSDGKQIHLHGVKNGEGDSLERALSGWNGADKKKGANKRFSIDRPEHELVGILEFDGVVVPSEKDQKLFDKINKAGAVAPEDIVKLDGISNRRAGYGQIHQKYASLETFNQAIQGKFSEPKETMSERVERGEVQVVNPGEYIENLESISTGAVGLSESDTELFDPETLLLDEPAISDANQIERDLKNKHGIPAPELDTIIEELESQAEGRAASLEDVATVFYSEDGGKTFKDYPVWSAFLQGESDDIALFHAREAFNLIQQLHNARLKQTTQASGQGSDGGAQAPLQDIQPASPESGRAQTQDTGDAQAVSGQTGDRAAQLSQREPEGPGADPQGDRSRGSRALDWSRVDDGHVAYAGDFVFSVDGGPKVWDLRIDNIADESVLYAETFIGELDQAIASIEAQVLAKLTDKAEPAARNAPASVERQTSQAQPDRKAPDDKPKLVAIQGDRIPQVSDRVGDDSYDLDEVGKQGVNLALNAHANGRPGFLNSDGTGVGKSRQAIAVMNEIQRDTGGRVLYVTENAQQITKFEREMQVMGVSNPQIEFTTYTQVGTGKLANRKFAAIVFDEAHNLKNADSKKASGAANIKTDFTMFMTATPMDKVEAAAYFISTITGTDEDTVLNRLGLERHVNQRKDGSFYSFIQKQGGVTNGDIRIRLNELRNTLIAEGAMIRREYPFYGTREVINVELNERQSQQQETILDYWESKSEESGGRNVAGQRLLDLNRWVEPLKADAIYERMKDDLANGRSVVIVAETVGNQWVAGLKGESKGDNTADYSGMIGAIAARLEADGIPFSKIYGNGNKSKAVDAFQSGENRVALMTPKSGGAGIDLDDQHGAAPRSVYIATMNFSGDVFEQIMGRFSRRNTMSPTKLHFVAMPKVVSETHRGATLQEKLATLATFQGKVVEDQDNDIRDLFSDAALAAPHAGVPLLDPATQPVRSFNHTALPEGRVGSTKGIDYEISRASAPSPFLIDKHIDMIAKEFGADAGARTLIRNILEAIPGEKLQTLDIRVVDDPAMSAGEYDVDRRLLTLNKAASLNQGNGIALAFTHEMGHFYVNEVIGFDFVRDQWQSLGEKQRADAWNQYLKAQGIHPSANAKDLVSNDTAAQEWAAFQFTRIAREGVRGRDTLTKQMRKEGMSKSLIETLTSWYDQLRQWIDMWIGDADLSTTQLDEAVINALGIESDEGSMKADAKRQQEFLATRAAEKGFASIEEFAVEDIQGFGTAARQYRASKSVTLLNSPDQPLDSPGKPYTLKPKYGYALKQKIEESKGSGSNLRDQALEQADKISEGSSAVDGSPQKLPRTDEERIQLERTARTRQGEALLQWAIRNGEFIDPDSFDSKRERWIKDRLSADSEISREDDDIAGGAENLVYYDINTGRWVKRNVLAYSWNFGTLIQRIKIHNTLFPSTAIRFDGITAGINEEIEDRTLDHDINERGNQVHLVMSQMDVHAEINATQSEIESHMVNKLGFRVSRWVTDSSDPRGKVAEQFYHPELGVFVEDLHSENVLRDTTTNKLAFIDPMIRVAYPYEKAGTLQAPAGHRNPEIRKKLKDVDDSRTSALMPKVTGREEAGKKIVVENAWATHSELRDIAASIYDQMRKQKFYSADFDSFYQQFTATPMTPRQAREYLGGLEAGIDDVSRSDLDADQQRNVDDYLLTELYETRKMLEARVGDNSKQIDSLLKQIEREEARLHKHQVNYNNAEALERGAVDELKAYLKGFKKALGAKGGVAKLGKLGEVIRQLEGQQEIDNRIARKYTVGIERLIASEEPFVLFDLLEAVADSEVDLSGRADTVRNRFADAGISMIASLSDEKFAAVLSIAKADRQLLDTIILRKLPDTAEKLAIVESEVAETKGDFKRAGKAITKIKKHSALKGRIAGERALSKGRISRFKSQIKQKELNQKISSQAFERYDAEFNKVAGRVGATVQGHVTEGTGLMIPSGTDATKEDILGSVKVFRYDETTADDITRIIVAQREWLDGPQAEENRVADPVFYNQIKTQNARLIERTFKEVHAKGSSLSGRLYFDSLANSFSKLNLPASHAISQMLQKIESRSSAWHNEAATLGEQSDKARYKLGRALKLEKTPNLFVRRFGDMIDTPMKSYMEQPGADINGFIAQRFPNASDEVVRLIERYYQAEKANSQFIRRVTETSMQQAGMGSVTNDRILVPDYANGGKLTPIEQTHRNLGSGTFLIRPDMDVIGGIVQQFGSADQIGQVVRALEKGELDADQANALVDQLFADPESFDSIVGALARKEKVPVFSNANGDLVEREASTEAFEQANTPSNFFENLYDGIGSADGIDYNAYLAEQLAEVQRLYADIAKTEENFQESKNSPTSISGHVAIDARKKDAWPSEWLTYRQGGSTANNIIVSQNVMASIFGKNGERLNKEKASILGALRKNVLDAQRKGDLALKQKHSKELERADRYFKQLDRVLGSELGPLRDLKLPMELMNTLVGGVLNGPRAAMVQLNQIYQPILHFGISGTTFRMMKNQAKTAAQDLFGSFFEAIGITINRDSEAFNMQKELYGLEPEKTNGYLGFTGDMGNEGGISSGQRKVRIMNTLMSRRGISKAKAEDALYTSFKPWAPFSQLIGALHKAPMVAFRSEFDRLAGLAIKHADKALPNGGDLTQVNFNHKTLGFKSKSEFDRLNSILQEKVGTTLADVVASYRANKGGQPFTRDQYITMSSVGLDLMASEANVFTTRSPQMHTEMGRFVFPLLGWAIHQPHHAAKMFKGAEGEVTKRTIGAGLMTLGFGLVPAVMMMAVFEDWFDEHIMGKKRNLRPLTGAGPLDTANAVLERVTRNGMLGMPMEFVNLGMNIGGEGDLRTASLDQRVFLAGTIRGMIQLVGNTAHQKAFTWESGGRRLLQNTGANGYLQQIDMFSELLNLDNPESRVVARINANNYLRVGGRMVGLESRPFSGSVTPTPVTPWVTKMQVAAQANDAGVFQAAYKRAVEAARQLGKTGPREAEDYIAQNWNSRHPLKGPFRSPPTPGEYQQLLKAIGPSGASDVRLLVSQYNLFGSRIGAKAYLGKAQRGKSSSRLTMRDVTGL